MKRFIPTLFLCLCLCSCATAPKRSALHYSPPSVAPVRHAIESAKVSIDTAQAHAAKAKSALNLQDFPAASAEIDLLSSSLMEAQTNLADSQTRVTELDEKIVNVTNNLNQALDDKNAALDRAAKLDADRKRMVSQRNKLALLLSAAAVWILRKPLFAFVRMVASFFGFFG